MDLSKLSQALTPANLADTTELVVSDKFSITVCYANKINQAYNLKLAEFSKKFPDHAVSKKPNTFWAQFFDLERNADTVSFVANVILCGWKLEDDSGEQVPFSSRDAIKLLNTKVGHAIFGKLIQACLNETTFQLGWTEDALKN